MPVETLQAIPCPGNEDLRKLLRGKLADSRQQVLETHLDDCTGCRSRLELMADAETNLSDVVRHIDKNKPPQDSAYWKALNTVEADMSMTSTFSGLKKTPNDNPAGELAFLRPSALKDKIGKLGDFEIIREIGRGGMGVVLQALDPHLDREVAIKVLDPEMANNKMARQRFCREARAAAAVTHDHIVTVFQVNEDEAAGLPYLVMQLIKGESLEQRIRRQGKLSVIASVRYAMQAAQGLAAAHAVGLIHRDIKPGNILIEESTDKASLTDFGLARAHEDLKLTRTGFVAGTPLYMAPEQARGDAIDARADLFSLGSVMYESLAGRPPFEGTSALAVLRRVADEAHPRLSRLNPAVPDWLEDVIDQLLEKKPEHRIASAEELGRTLQMQICTLEPDGVTTSPVECTVARSASRLVGRRRKNALTTALVLAVPFLIGGLFGALMALYLTPEPRNDSLMTPVIGNNGIAITPATTAAGPEPYRTLDAITGAVWSVAAAADGNKIVAGLEDGSFVIWNLETRARLLTREAAHNAPILSVDISDDGSTVVTGGDDGIVKVWDISMGVKLLQELKHDTAVRSVAFDHSGTRIVTGDRAGMVRIWLRGEEKPLKQFNHGGTISAVAFAPDHLTVASVSTNKTAKLWDVTNGNNTFTYSQHKGPIYGVAFSPDGAQIATASWDKTVMIWNPSTGETNNTIPMQEDGLVSVSFSNCGGYLAAAAQDGTVKVWHAPDGVEVARFTRHKGTVHSVKFLPTCGTLLTGGRDGFVRAWTIK